MSVSLAVKYRPKIWYDVCEQNATRVILQQQLIANDIKNSYLFCGPPGCGKTTCARIFANEINEGKGSPIELDAASNNSVDDVREIIQQSKTASLDSEYKVFIMDEVHALSNSAWQAMLKVLEEPPKKSIFIMCTTDPQKIPNTILSRVQRYDFQKISQQGIVSRIAYILDEEDKDSGVIIDRDREAIEYIAKTAQGGMRDALTMLDKCLAYSSELTLENVMKALGEADYSQMMELTRAISERDYRSAIEVLNSIYMSGKDLKQFMKQYTTFVLDMCKYVCNVSIEYFNCPMTDDIQQFMLMDASDFNSFEALKGLIALNNELKWDTNPKSRIEAWIITGE